MIHLPIILGLLRTKKYNTSRQKIVSQVTTGNQRRLFFRARLRSCFYLCVFIDLWLSLGFALSNIEAYGYQAARACILDQINKFSLFFRCLYHMFS